MNKIYAYLWFAFILLGIIYGLYRVVLDYNQRMIEYNTHACAVYGKQPDCKTPL